MHLKTKGHQVAYRALSRWLGRDATAEDFTPTTIRAFQRSAIAASVTQSTWRSYCSSLRVLARQQGHIFPGDQPDVADIAEVDGEMTVWGLFEKHYRPRRLIGKSENTTRLYRTTVRKFSRHLERPAMLTDLTDEVVAYYLDALTKQNALQSVVKEYDQLMAIWRFAARRKMVENYPDIMRPSAPKPVPDAFTPEEMQQLLAAARAWEGDYFDVPCGIWWEAMIRLVYDTGERIGAILKMTPAHLQGDWVLVPATSRKGAQQGKRFKVSPTTREMLAKIAALQSEECLFAWPQSYTYFWKIFGRILEAAGLPLDRRGKWHKVRRTVATFYEAKGGDATALLGHSSRKVTEAYLDNRYIEKPQPCDLIEPL